MALVNKQGKHEAIGLSRKQIEERNGGDLLRNTREVLETPSYKKAAGFSLGERLREIKGLS